MRRKKLITHRTFSQSQLCDAVFNINHEKLNRVITLTRYLVFGNTD